jgi:hypothetical protein
MEGVVGVDWCRARRFLPFDLDEFAVSCGALTRRRGVKGGEALVRLVCLAALPKVNLERAAFMAREAGFANLGKTAMFKRLAHSEDLLRKLFAFTLQFAGDQVERWGEYQLVGVDATTICGPGSKGTDLRAHVVYDLAQGLPRSVDLTGPEGGETLKRHSSFGFGDLVLADRGYGHERGLMSALRSGARLLVRFQFESIRLLDDDGNRLNPASMASLIPEDGATSVPVFLQNWPAPLRAIGERNPKGEVVWLLTDLPFDELSDADARQLYRRRWQIELFFKRLKSLVDLDEIPTRDGPTAKAWVWAKLLLCSLAVLISDERFSPWGCPPSTKPLASTRVRFVGDFYGSAVAPCHATHAQKKASEKTGGQKTETRLLLEA